jgi:hypothetical protein
MALLLFGRDKRLRLLSALTLTVGGVTFVLAQSLQALLGLGMALLIIAAWRSRWFLLSIPLGLLAFAGWLLAYGPDRAVLASLSLEHPIGIGVALRLDIWSRALAMIHDMPYTGVGLNAFPLIHIHFYPGFLLGPEPHAHNLFLQAGVDLGLPGLGALLWLLAAFYLTVIQAYRATSNRNLRVLLVGLAAGVLAYIGHGLLDTVPLGAKPVAALFAMLGMAAAPLRRGDKEMGRQGKILPVSLSPCPLVSLSQVSPCHLVALSRYSSGRLVAVLFLILLLLSPLMAPAAPYLNLGAIRAHKALLAARASGPPRSDILQTAVGPLRRALVRDPDNAHAYELLGSIYAWQGDYDAALKAFGHRVRLDGQDPIARYAPFETLRRRIQGEAGHDNWDDTLQVYSQWMTRFPDRAETYVQIALVWDRCKSNPDHAIAVLRSGLDNGARPRGLLYYYLSQIERGR